MDPSGWTFIASAADMETADENAPDAT